MVEGQEQEDHGQEQKIKFKFTVKEES